MKRSPLIRRTELRSSPSSLLRGSGLNRVSAKGAKQNAERTKALAPLRAAQPWCSRCGVTGVGLDAHELLSRARGGSITDLANIVLLCRGCHDDVTFRHHEIPDADRWILTASMPLGHGETEGDEWDVQQTRIHPGSSRQAPEGADRSRLHAGSGFPDRAGSDPSRGLAGVDPEPLIHDGSGGQLSASAAARGGAA